MPRETPTHPEPSDQHCAFFCGFLIVGFSGCGALGGWAGRELSNGDQPMTVLGGAFGIGAFALLVLGVTTLARYHASTQVQPQRRRAGTALLGARTERSTDISTASPDPRSVV